MQTKHLDPSKHAELVAMLPLFRPQSTGRSAVDRTTVSALFLATNKRAKYDPRFGDRNNPFAQAMREPIAISSDAGNEELLKLMITRQYAVNRPDAVPHVEEITSRWYSGRLRELYISLTHQYGVQPAHQHIRVEAHTMVLTDAGAPIYLSTHAEACRRRSASDASSIAGLAPVVVTTPRPNSEIARDQCRHCGLTTSPPHWGNECPLNPNRKQRGKKRKRETQQSRPSSG